MASPLTSLKIKKRYSVARALALGALYFQQANACEVLKMLQ